MTLVYIIDLEAKTMAGALASLARRQALEIEFEAHTTLQALFQSLTRRSPDLVVLHHNWSGIGVSQVLHQIESETAGGTRVVVFTGQTVKIRELIECVRCGAADYWTKGTYEVAEALTLISYYCASPAWTLENLKMPSGSLKKLLDQADGTEKQLSSLEQINKELMTRNEALTNMDRERLLGKLFALAKLVVIGLVLVASFLAVDKYAKLDSWANIWLTSIIALCFLLSEGKIASAYVRWAEGAAGVKAQPPGPH